jgi:hypothetical protein
MNVTHALFPSSIVTKLNPEQYKVLTDQAQRASCVISAAHISKNSIVWCPVFCCWETLGSEIVNTNTGYKCGSSKPNIVKAHL